MDHEFKEGDIFYTRYDGKYHLYKLLKHDETSGGYHVMSYKALDALPGKYGIDDLEVSIYHIPMHKESFTGAEFYTHSTVTDDDLIGYYTYLGDDADFEKASMRATEYYHEAYLLTNEGKYDAAIEKYSKAIELIPEFHEAIDNRAFCKMDLGLWLEAIADFQLSLRVNPGSLLAEFSIGECYYRLGEFGKAKEQFEKCVEIDPNHAISKEFLIRSEELMQQSK